MAQQAAIQAIAPSLKGADLLKALGVAAAGSAVVIALAYLLLPAEAGSRFPLVLLLTGLEEAILFATAWWFGLRRAHWGWETLGFRPLGAGINLALPVLILFASVAFTAAYTLVVSRLGLASLTPPAFPAALREGSTLPLALAGGVVIFWGPLAEETFFRGFLLQGLLPRWGPVAASLASALLFALSHGSLGTMIPAFASGLLLAWLFLHTRSIWACFTAHALQNALVFILGV
ncbi:MAG: CPBP family intramembrane metalloprotease [Chloroflexi bacterium]|nr:CPBP family intramembrane metalloprotease [Chloroflexota bacterium]